MCSLLVGIWSVLVHVRIFICLAVPKCAWHVLYRVRRLSLQPVRGPARTRAPGYLKWFMMGVWSVVELIRGRCVALGRLSAGVHEGVVGVVVVALVVYLIWV